jgi:dUTP pyrophosphatase
LQIDIINQSTHSLPQYQTEGSAGMDLHAFLPEDLILDSFDRTIVPTGLFIALPAGVEAQIRPRSGLALKQGITCLNTPGTIDSDYRGEIKVLLINLSKEKQVIRNGDRIAQMVIAKYESIQWNSAETLKDSLRGEGGFGSTG